MSKSTKLAYHVLTKKVIHIDQALRGLSCACKCLVCGDRLVAAKGSQKDHHFKHLNTENCGGGLETALHLLAKQIIVENIQISIPKYGKIGYKDAVSEKTLEDFIPDVSATLSSNDEPVFFEICCTHALDHSKKQFFLSKKLKCVEIDMKNCPVDKYESIKDFVLNETKEKLIIFWNPLSEGNKIKKPTQWWNGIIYFIGFFLVVYLIFPERTRKLWNKFLK